MVWAKKTGRMKPCKHCGTEFYCHASKEAGSRHGESLFCSSHCYKAERRNGKDADTLLWEKINKNGPNGCWVYSGATDRRGYGRPATKTIRYYAHRRSYEIHKGPIPPGMLVLHSCDNPPCCNPDHLSLGKDADNHKDMRARGRANYISRAKLTEDQVREIRRDWTGKNADELAGRYRLSPTAIYCAATRRTWVNIK